MNNDQHKDHKAYTEGNIQTIRSLLKAIIVLSDDAPMSEDVSRLAKAADVYCDCLDDNVDDYSMLLEAAEKKAKQGVKS